MRVAGRQAGGEGIMDEGAAADPSGGPFCLQQITLTECSEDDYQYEEIPADDDFSVQEGDEDLMKALQTMEDQAVDAQIMAQRPSQVMKHSLADVPEAVDDFLCNFLVRMGMNRTLDCFQTEWYELMQRGILEPKDIGLVPDAYTCNQHLERENKCLKKELENYQLVANRAKEALLKIQRERDFHRMHHKRVVQEKNRLINDIKRLKTHYASYEPMLRKLNEKYETLLRQKMLTSLERDRAVWQITGLRATLQSSEPGSTTQILMPRVGHGCEREEGIEGPSQRALKEAKDPKMSSGGHPCDPVKQADKRYPKDSMFPEDIQVNPYLAHAKECVRPLNSGVYRLSNTLKVHDLAVSSLALHPRKDIVVTASDDRLWKMWAFPSGNIIMKGEGHTDWLSGCCFHPSERCRYTLRGHKDSVNSIEFLPFSNTILTSSADKTLSLWDARTGLCAQTFCGHLHSCNHATFNMKGDTIASCDSYGVLKLWDIRRGAPMVSIDAGPHPGNQVAFDPSGHIIALASHDGTVKVLELKSGQLSSLVGHDDEVQSVLFDHKAEHLISGGSDGTLRIWN
ncbi:sperm-associated antigen 16 protein [Sphaerodactylus townsendi]|uniref:sperm-associated antigen 16 protein n=1 Tax=Sphaerodactylus townsendi TaxID=933632 RepID=UPI002026A6EC|nr:sperm-associated antigen 16 protein [Sphaerodactylus townsendi]